MTPEQRKAAQALFPSNLISIETLEKAHALEMHRKACKWVTKYNLPYRVSMDYLKRYDHTSGIVLINECYPAAGYKRSDLLPVTVSELDYDNPALFTVNENGERVYSLDVFKTPKPAVMARIEEHNRQFRTWDTETAAGLEAWEHEFAHFLEGYDFDRFTPFDMIGQGNMPADELNARKAYYKAIQARFEGNKSAYRTEEPPAVEGTEYTTDKFILKH